MSPPVSLLTVSPAFATLLRSYSRAAKLIMKAAQQAAVLVSLTGDKGIHEVVAAPDSVITLHSLHKQFHHDMVEGSCSKADSGAGEELEKAELWLIAPAVCFFACSASGLLGSLQR